MVLYVKYTVVHTVVFFSNTGGVDYMHTNEFVQSCFSDGVLILRYINKMATDGGDGVVDGRDGNDCKPYWSRVEIPTWMQFFSQSFVQIHTNKFIQLLYKLYSTNSYTVWFLYQFIHFYTNCIVQIHTSRERAAQPRASSASREGRSPSTPPAPTRPHPAAPTFRVHLAAPTS